MQKAYKYSIIYFLAFSMLLLMSSILLFQDKIGFSIQSILSYYRGNEYKFISVKTESSLFEIILPHIFAFGLFLMVILHFFIFTEYKNQKQIKFLIYFVFIMAALELSSPFFIINGVCFFAYIKIFSFVGFQLSLLYLFLLLFISIVYD